MPEALPQHLNIEIDILDRAWQLQTWHHLNHTFEDVSGVWSVPRLWRAARELQEFDVSVESLVRQENLHEMPLMRMAEMVEYIQEVEKADLSFPILLGPTGYVVDGFHRLTKARIEKRESLKARQLLTMPPPGCLECRGLGWFHMTTEYGTFIDSCQGCALCANEEEAYEEHQRTCGCPWADTPTIIVPEP